MDEYIYIYIYIIKMLSYALYEYKTWSEGTIHTEGVREQSGKNIWSYTGWTDKWQKLHNEDLHKLLKWILLPSTHKFIK
jgi:hypothetical protein